MVVNGVISLAYGVVMNTSFDGISRKFQNGDYVKARQFRGIALCVIGPSELEFDESWFICDHNSDYDSYCNYCNGEYDYEDLEKRYSDSLYDCYMVGDNEIHKIDESDLEPLENGFCIGCGQIGCGHNPIDL